MYRQEIRICQSLIKELNNSYIRKRGPITTLLQTEKGHNNEQNIFKRIYAINYFTKTFRKNRPSSYHNKLVFEHETSLLKALTVANSGKFNLI